MIVQHGEYKKHILDFKFKAGTSRGVLTEKVTFYIIFHGEGGEVGYGEASPLPGLSLEWGGSYEKELAKYISECINKVSSLEDIYSLPNIKSYPSILMGLEMAYLDLLSEQHFNWYQPDHEMPSFKLPINGLVWMGDAEFMQEQIQRKIEDGFNCVKMKVGAINFDEEVALLKSIRAKFSAEDMIIRVDANGAFTSVDEAMKALDVYADLDVESIEQPMRQGQWEAMKELCRKTKIPIALDEELIGVLGSSERERMLEDIQPQYIVLKPSLIGGFKSTAEWIALAEARGIGWWITSALESNIGLAAITQFTSTLPINGRHQGLGTGALYHNNIPSPLEVKNGNVHYDYTGVWDIALLQS